MIQKQKTQTLQGRYTQDQHLATWPYKHILLIEDERRLTWYREIMKK